MEVDEIIPCPVCQLTMLRAGNPNIYYCPSGKINCADPYPHSHFGMSHAQVYTNNIGMHVYSKIIAAEYCFEIFYLEEYFSEDKNNTFSSAQKTIIKMIKKIDKLAGDITMYSNTFGYVTDDQFEFEFVHLLTINAAVSLPWNDHTKIRDTVKTYLTFS